MNEQDENLALEDHVELAQQTAKTLPKLVEILVNLPPLYRRKAVEAAITLLQDAS